MLIRQSTSADTGPSSVALAAQAAKLESLLWAQVLSGMTKTALGGKNALGTGSGIYNGIADRALAGRMFGKTDSRLTHEIVAELTDATSSGSAGSSGISTLAALQSSATESNATGGASGNTSKQTMAFARKIWPAVKDAAASLGVSPVAILAQTALETGWGASVPGNNPLGIKATSATASSVSAMTQEFGDGGWQNITAQFAAFPSLSAALQHLTSLIRNRYPGAIGAQSVSQYADALAAGGYATDPHYAAHIVDVAQSPTMRDVLSKLDGA